MTTPIESILLQIVDKLPKSALSVAVGKLSDKQLPPGIRSGVNAAVAYLTGMDLSESQGRPGDYKSINELFTRQLRPGTRPIEARDSGQLTCPVDGTLSQFGRIRDKDRFPVKGGNHTLGRILGSKRDAQRHRDGHYAIFYLSPSDYHRIHSPGRGWIDRLRYIPGYLYPVNPLWVRHVDDLFAVNERLISFFTTQTGRRIGFVKVGATCVGRITLSFEDFETTGHDRPLLDFPLDEPTHFEHGDEVGVFNLGSTVVLFIEGTDFEFAPWLSEGQNIKMGAYLGQWNSR